MLIQAKFMKELLRDFFIPCKENGFKPRILETQFFFMLLGLLVGLKVLTLVSFWGGFGRLLDFVGFSYLVNVVTIAPVRWEASGTGMWLVDVTKPFQLSHF